MERLLCDTCPINDICVKGPHETPEIENEKENSEESYEDYEYGDPWGDLL